METNCEKSGELSTTLYRRSERKESISIYRNEVSISLLSSSDIFNLNPIVDDGFLKIKKAPMNNHRNPILEG